MAVLGFSGPVDKWIALQLIPFAIRKHKDVTANVLQDTQKGKLTEVNAIKGAMCEWGRRSTSRRHTTRWSSESSTSWIMEIGATALRIWQGLMK
jgi:hypothetical protein